MKVKAKPKWYYDEFKHPGVDFSNPDQVKNYDDHHRKFRDYEKEGETLIQSLGLGPKDQVIDMGCGTGAFTCYAAKFCRTIYAVDVSPAMLDFCKQKARQNKLQNIEFHHGGFLTYEHKAKPVDAVVSTVALHHLPDFWKLIGLKRVWRMLKPGGKFYLGDMVYSFDINRYEAAFNGMVEGLARQVDDNFAQEAVTTIRDEQVTLNWIMEGLIRQAGFRIDTVRYQGMIASYICTKEKMP